MSPRGDVDRRRSMPQPIPAPTRTPATSSDESRKPSAMAEALDATSPFPPAGWSVLSLRLSRSADNRWSRLPSLAESAASSGDFSRLPSPLPSVRSAIFGDPTRVAGNRNYAPSPSKAARTILTAPSRVKIACSMVSSLIRLNFWCPRRVASVPGRCGAKQGRVFSHGPVDFTSKRPIRPARLADALKSGRKPYTSNCRGTHACHRGATA